MTEGNAIAANNNPLPFSPSSIVQCFKCGKICYLSNIGVKEMKKKEQKVVCWNCGVDMYEGDGKVIAAERS